MPNVHKIKKLLGDCKKNNVRSIKISNDNGNKTTEVEFDTLSKYRIKSLKVGKRMNNKKHHDVDNNNNLKHSLSAAKDEFIRSNSNYKKR